MKKSVAVIFIFAFIALFLAVYHGRQIVTGSQVLDLPAPPAPPGMEQEPAPTPTPPPAVGPAPTPRPTNQTAAIASPTPEGATIEARLDSIEEKLNKVLALLPSWEQRLNNVEAQASQVANMGARIDGMQSQVDGMRVDLENLKNRPSVDMPTFLDNIKDIQSSMTRNTILSVSLSVLVLIILVGMITASIISHRNERIENKQLIKQYLENYQRAGYRLETLRMHLRACGWPDDFVDECIRELPR